MKYTDQQPRPDRSVARLARYSVDWTVRDCIAKYPSLFHSRTQVLHHLFIVLGCGYTWVNGKLVRDKGETTRKDQIPREAVEILADHTMPIEHPYPWCEMCNLAEMPSDVDDDWKSAAEEIREAYNQGNYFAVAGQAEGHRENED